MIKENELMCPNCSKNLSKALKYARQEEREKLWLMFHKEIRNILIWVYICSLAITILSGFQIVSIINTILYGGIIVYLDFIKY